MLVDLLAKTMKSISRSHSLGQLEYGSPLNLILSDDNFETLWDVEVLKMNGAKLYLKRPADFISKSDQVVIRLVGERAKVELNCKKDLEEKETILLDFMDLEKNEQKQIKKLLLAS
ncbi:hypothetical protein HBN50_06875 [Halobacteriovorax sp. GB3]|uniref:hypothetical protein n=1 Tax=Halobacteriovorax sp. GB3 TaxID=2719615 RepID=UPI00235E08F7|nr:hypothetical protein [Halobacteriovorax sp. GB3]MDD0852810.1 hypothetical protein [Halobacteriovorax sp. GB3]